MKSRPSYLAISKGYYTTIAAAFSRPIRTLHSNFKTYGYWLIYTPVNTVHLLPLKILAKPSLRNETPFEL